MALNKQYGPSVIAKSFIKQYYEKLAQSPADLHKFYSKENSSFTFADGAQDSEAVVGTEAIRELVGTLPFFGARVDLTEGSLDVQQSDRNIMIVVTGEISLSGQSAKNFLQAFWLAPQSLTSASFYVSNSVLRLLSAAPVAAAAPAATAAAFEPVVEPEVAVVKEIVVEVAPVYVAPTPAPAPAPTPAPVVVEEVVVEEPVVEEPVVEEEEEEEVVVEAPVEAQRNTGPKSYKDVTQGSVAAASTGRSPVKKSRSVPRAAAPAAPAAATAEVVAPAAPVKAAPAPAPVQKKPPSIFVKFDGADPSPAELTDFFSSFGKVVDVEVLPPPKGFGFVTFANHEALKSVFSNKDALNFQGHRFVVEERNVTKGPAGGRKPLSGKPRGERTGAPAGEKSGDRAPKSADNKDRAPRAPRVRSEGKPDGKVVVDGKPEAKPRSARAPREKAAAV